MKPGNKRHELEIRAAEALKAALGEVSTIKVREIRHDWPEASRDAGFTAYVDVFGRHHTLACDVETDAQPHRLRSALDELRHGVSRLHGDATPVIIAPHLSAEAQALCKENKAGFLDFEGNVRLSLGEVFIVKRTLPHHGQHRAAPESSRPAA